MIAVDASAALAVLLGEPDAELYRGIFAKAGGLMSPVNYWEVLARVFVLSGEPAVERAEVLLQKLGLTVASVGQADARDAYVAFARYGKGQGGPLNLGDCFAYALAAREGDGLLYKGGDFARTDVKSAIP